MVLLIN